jgi:flagellar basal body P-ring formation chaperone FlgA
MKLKSGITLFGVAIFLTASFAAPAKAMRMPRIELLREVRVTGASVFLSDLLPAEAGASLQTRAGQISLGAAPQPGSTRVLERAGVLGNVGATLDVAAEIAVPERMTISREARPITVQEVFAAIRNAMELGGISAAANLRPEDILLQTQILVEPGDAGLQVLRSEFDAGLKRGRFLLWPAHDPKVLPFFATVRFAENGPPGVPHFEGAANRIASQPDARPARVMPAKAEILVAPGETATLLLQSDALRMIADVVPLERGAMGQHVQVRVVDTGKIFRAQVDGRAHLLLNF